MLCYFAVYLAEKRLDPQTIQSYLSGIRNMQISMGFPDPRDQSTLPYLKRVQAGIKRRRAQEQPNQRRVRLPLTVTMLEQIRSALNASFDQDRELVWAVASVAFFGFFRLGELLLESGSAHNQSTDLSWGDVATDSRHTPTLLRIHLK